MAEDTKPPTEGRIRGRWIIENVASAHPEMVLMERFEDREPTIQEWEIWVEGRDGESQAEKLNGEPIKARTFYEAVQNHIKLVPSKPIHPGGRRPASFYYTDESVQWRLLSPDHPGDRLGRRLFPDEESAKASFG